MTTMLPSHPTPLVLVVDDDMMVRLLAREALEPAGFQVAEAEDGAAAVAAVVAARPAIVLLDVMMPVMDGFTACTALRQTPEGEDIPILMMTGLDDVESIHRAYEAGATDFVAKPINWLILGHRVQYMLRASAALQGIKASEARLAKAQRLAQLGNWDWDIRQDHWQGSAEWYRLLGVPPEQFAGTSQAFLAGVHPDHRARVSAAHAAALQAGQPCHFSYHILRPDGTQCSVQERAEVILDGTGQVIALAGTLQDITAREQAEEKIRYLAYYDTLTGLPNRQSFLQAVEQALDGARQQERLVAILFLDLDNFKRINDTLGHPAGDLLLQAVADRLQQHVRTIDLVARYDVKDLPGNIARLGGDEFTILLSEIQRLGDVATVAQRIQAFLSQPLSLAGHDVVTTSSMGIVVFPHDGQDVEQLLKNADTAMYHAKEAGKSTYRFYTASMNARALQRLNLEHRLRKALEQEEFFLCYQPQVELQSSTLVGLEVLLRWHNPELGLVSPAEFIPLAEETGLILTIGDWIVHTACAQNKAWQAAGFPPLRLAVNLSSLQFRQQNLAASIGRVLAATALDPHYLELELTESMIMQHTQEALKTLYALKEMGLRLSVDDFGTGYSSLSYLKRFPLDTLKIDQSFIKDITVDANDAAITTAIIAMAHSLNLKVIAEGVETEQQLAFLRHHHCDEVQGYLLGKPLPAEAVTRLLETSGAILAPGL